MLSIFSCVCWQSVYLLWRNVYLGLLPIFRLSCLLFWYWAASSCGERGPLFIAVHGPLTIAASLVAEHRLQTHRLSNCGSWAQLLCGMWDLPRPGLEPMSPALAGRFSTTAPPGKPPWILIASFDCHHHHCDHHHHHFPVSWVAGASPVSYAL